MIQKARIQNTAVHRFGACGLLFVVGSFLGSLWSLPALSRSDDGNEISIHVRALNVHNNSDDVMCSVRRNSHHRVVGESPDGKWVRIEVSPGVGCPKGVKSGWVWKRFVRVRHHKKAEPNESLKSGGDDYQVRVMADGLHLRKSSRLRGSKIHCNLGKNTRLDVMEAEGRALHVALVDPIPKGCPREGWVAAAYTESVDSGIRLPRIEKPEAFREPCIPEDTAPLTGSQARGLSSEVGDIAGLAPGAAPFLDALRARIDNPSAPLPRSMKTSRGLIQLPIDPENPRQGFCGSWHYNSDRPMGNDAYTNPLTACVFSAFLQKWKTQFCPSGNQGCRIQWGDISHKDHEYWDGHKTHTHGQCIDMRPPSKGGFEDAPITYTQSRYDRAKTQELIALARSMGATNLLFADPAIRGVEYNADHHNHIHLCFKDNSTTRNSCQRFSVNPQVCPELGE